LAHGAHAPYHAAPSPLVELGLDYDQRTALPSPELEPKLPITLSTFPRGAQAGTFFHQILEDLDFQNLSELESLVVKNLGDHGFEEHWAPLVCQALQEILKTPFAPDLALQDIPRTARLDELQFTIPVATQAGAGAHALESEALAKVIEDAQDEGLPPGYASQIRSLGFPRLRGFLTGFVDLIFLHEDRWYVVDYKSNHLGDGLEAYHHAKLPKAMAESHYVLQYLLYTVALHRFLQQRLPEYSYETHIGGVYYLYLKGMHPSRGHNHGCYSHRPSWVLVQGLDRLLREGVNP
jgi:exodeoxyribonuclease V beta subunit